MAPTQQNVIVYYSSTGERRKHFLARNIDTHSNCFFLFFPSFFRCREKCLFSVVIIPKRAKPFFFTLPPGSSLFRRMYVCLVQKEGPDSCRLLYGRNSRGDFITRRERKKNNSGMDVKTKENPRPCGSRAFGLTPRGASWFSILLIGFCWLPIFGQTVKPFLPLFHALLPYRTTSLSCFRGYHRCGGFTKKNRKERKNRSFK